MADFERRAMCRDEKFTTRAEDGNLYIEGYFAVFGYEYRIWEHGVETIDRGAFDGALNDDIRALTNHDTTLVLGRTTAGTLSLIVDDRGLYGVITVNQADQDAVNLYERVKRGDVSQCSFGFDILDQSIEERADGTTLFTVKRVKLYEVSVCTFPAYEETEVKARMADAANAKEQKLNAWRDKVYKKLKGDQANGT